MKKVLLVFLPLMLFFSCDPARRLIRQYDTQHDTLSVLLFPPDYLYRTNSRNISIEGYSQYTQYQKDSALFFSSLFVQHLNDSACLSNLVNTFIDSLQTKGFKVYLPERMDEFLSFTGKAYLLNFAQSEMEEYDYQIWPNYEVEGYGDSYTVNGVKIKNWIEFSERDDTAKMKVLYSSWNYEDKLTLRMGVTSGSTFGFVNSVEFLTLDKIYEACTDASAKNVALFSDFILNRFLDISLSKKKQKYYFFYSQKKRIRKYGKKFVEM